MRKTACLAVAALLCSAFAGWSQTPPLQPSPRRRAPALSHRATTGATENVLALHEPSSPQYNGACLSCHRGVLTETSRDPRVPSFHQAMLPFTPGYNPAHGPSDAVCVQCHRFVEVRTDSAGALRKQVDPALCALCHGPSGPGPQFYQR